MKLPRIFIALSAALSMSFIGVCGAVLVAPAHAQTASDRDALVALYNATGGDNWINTRNWLSEKPIDQWNGVTTDLAGRVIALHLINNQLSGNA